MKLFELLGPSGPSGESQMRDTINNINRQVNKIDKYYNDNCPTYKVDIPNNICTKIPDLLHLYPPATGTQITYVCPSDATFINPTEAKPKPMCVKCINGAIIQQDGTCKKANK